MVTTTICEALPHVSPHYHFPDCNNSHRRFIVQNACIPQKFGVHFLPAVQPALFNGIELKCYTLMADVSLLCDMAPVLRDTIKWTLCISSILKLRNIS